MATDGLDVLREQLELSEIMRLIENTAQWVDRETFQYLPIWFPSEARRSLMYKGNWSEPQYNTNKLTGEKVHKRAGNGNANKALTSALGLRSKDRPNWTCCHIWGVDDPTYQKPNSIASDRRFYSCVGNMVLLPTPLKAFTDVMQEVKDLLRIAATRYYGWAPEHSDLPSISEIQESCVWDAYPRSWPTESGKNSPVGVVKFNDVIRKKADRRKATFLEALKNSGPHYPKEDVLSALDYWNIDIAVVGR